MPIFTRINVVGTKDKHLILFGGLSLGEPLTQANLFINIFRPCCLNIQFTSTPRSLSWYCTPLVRGQKLKNNEKTEKQQLGLNMLTKGISSKI